MKIKYLCEECNKMYDMEDEAILCEEKHKYYNNNSAQYSENELHIPKKPINQSFSSNDSVSIGECPNCGYSANSDMKACQCGQALDWSI